MRFLIQRVTSARVDVAGQTVGAIDHGFLVFIGICNTDTREIADAMVKKLLGLRIFRDDNLYTFSFRNNILDYSCIAVITKSILGIFILATSTNAECCKYHTGNKK